MKQQSGSEALQSPGSECGMWDPFKLLISPGTDYDTPPGLIQAVYFWLCTIILARHMLVLDAEIILL